MSKRNIVHIEIPAKDSKASGEFYEKLFGWHIEHVEEMDYTMWDPHEGPGGGFSQVNENVKRGDVIIYVDSDDIDSDLKKAEELGGPVLREKKRDTKYGLVRYVQRSNR
jgi:predicted enzyme related to lactoylglutathione lyase